MARKKRSSDMDTELDRKSTQRPVVREFEIAKLRMATFNPSQRLEARALLELRRQIDAVGDIMQPPLVCNVQKDGSADIVDGHRRVTLAKSMGLTHIWCIVVSYNQAEAWIAANGGTRPITGREYAAAAWHGLRIDAIPGKNGKELRGLVGALGMEGLEMVVANGKAPSVWRFARELVRVVYGEETPDQIKVAFAWMVRFEMQKRARLVIDDIKKHEAGGLSEQAEEMRCVVERAMIDGFPIVFARGKWAIVGGPDGE